MFTAIPIDIDNNAENNVNISNISYDKSFTSKETESTTDSANWNSSNMEYVEKIAKEKRYKKPKTTKIYDMSDVEEKIRVERLKEIIKQEQQLADIKLQNEKRIGKIKADHLEEMNRLELNNIKEIHDIQLKIHKSQLQIIEHDLNKKN